MFSEKIIQHYQHYTVIPYKIPFNTMRFIGNIGSKVHLKSRFLNFIHAIMIIAVDKQDLITFNESK